MVDVVWQSPKPLDHFMLMDIFAEVDFSPVGSFKYNIVGSFGEANQEGVVAVIGGTQNKIKKLNEKLAKYKWVLLIVASDENNLFDFDGLDHPNIKVWIQTPRADKDYGNSRFFGVGYGFSAKYRSKFTQEYLLKYLDIFISGQNTHERRNVVFGELWKYKDRNITDRIRIKMTEGFTQGMKPLEYYRNMAQTKISPCPSGIVSPDSFRLYESLEFGAIPIADDVSPAEGYDSRGYWHKLFPDAPFPILQDAGVGKLIDEAKENYQQKANLIFAWWIKQKRKYAYDLVDDIRALSDNPVKSDTLKEKVTIIVPVSPWKDNPDTSKLETTLRSIRYHFPLSEIIVTFDGVREEQQHKFDAYQEFVKRMLWSINVEHNNILPLVFEKHTHQAGMMREALKYVRTDTVLYIEGDSPLYDREVDWENITNLLVKDKAKIVRLYNKESIPPEHEYLMYHGKDFKFNGADYIATSQWSQQPHIVRTDTYRYIIDTYFTEESVCFIEDKFYYIIVGEIEKGQWDKWKMFIYSPEDRQPRSYHLDGRDGEEKYDGNQKW